MVITNKLNLPEAMVQACDISPHNKDKCISATSLKKGVREFLLETRHWNELTDDVSDRIWAIFGTSVHALLERETPDSFTEENFEEKIGNWTVTGRLDNYNMKTETIEDYKTASTWKVIFKDFDDWKSQGLIYSWLLSKNGLKAKKCRFIAMLKDFSKSKAKFDPSYPQSPVYIYEFDVTDKDLKETEEFIINKIDELEKSVNLPDNELPMCTKKERWTKEEFAVYKSEEDYKAGKRALKVFKADKTSMEDAEKMADTYIRDCGGYKVDRSTDGKCTEYCSACEFCKYYKEHYAQEEKREAV